MKEGQFIVLLIVIVGCFVYLGFMIKTRLYHNSIDTASYLESYIHRNGIVCHIK